MAKNRIFHDIIQRPSADDKLLGYDDHGNMIIDPGPMPNDEAIKWMDLVLILYGSKLSSEERRARILQAADYDIAYLCSVALRYRALFQHKCGFDIDKFTDLVKQLLNEAKITADAISQALGGGLVVALPSSNELIKELSEIPYEPPTRFYKFLGGPFDGQRHAFDQVQRTLQALKNILPAAADLTTEWTDAVNIPVQPQTAVERQVSEQGGVTYARYEKTDQMIRLDDGTIFREYKFVGLTIQGI